MGKLFLQKLVMTRRLLAGSRIWRFGRWLIREHGGLLLVLLLALSMRVGFLRWSWGYPTGDVWNFVGIAEALGNFEYPITEKRLPFFPLLILVFHRVFPSVFWEDGAVVLALVSSLLVLVLFYSIGRRLGLRKVPLLVALILFVSFRPFFMASIRGYADTTFLSLLLASILALMLLESRGARLAAGPLIAALALTRYEGVVVAPVLLLIAILRLRPHPRAILAVLLGVSLLLLPYVALVRHTGRSVLPEAYVEEATPTTYGSSSLSAFLTKYGTVWERLGLFEVGKVPVGIVQHVIRDPLALPRWLTDLGREPLEAVALLAIPGFSFLIARRRNRDVLTVGLPFLVVALPIAWYAPYKRYDTFVWPLILFGTSAGLHLGSVVLSRATRRGGWGAIVRGMTAATLLAVATMVWLPPQVQEVHRGLERHRGSQRAYAQALRYVYRLPAAAWPQPMQAGLPGGRVALEVENAFTVLYFRSRGTYAGRLFHDRAPPKDRWQALRSASVDLVVTTTDPRAWFAFVRDPFPGISADEIRHFTSPVVRGPLDDVIVYRIVTSS